MSIKKKQQKLLKNIFIFFAVLVGVFFLWTNRMPILQLFQSKVVAPTNTFSQIYSGTLPCADCSGIEATLTLQPNGTYTYKQLYQGKDATFTENGTWTTFLKEFFGKQETVYRLIPDKSNTANYYLQTDSSHLQMLDNEQNIIDTPFNNTLTLQPTPQP